MISFGKTEITILRRILFLKMMISVGRLRSRKFTLASKDNIDTLFNIEDDGI
jgi:hypothetical protein